MDWRTRDLVCQHLKDQLRFDPDAGLDEGGDACWTMIDFQSACAFTNTAPLLITQPRADFGDGDEEVLFGSIQSQQQRTRTERCTLTTAEQVSQEDAVDWPAD